MGDEIDLEMVSMWSPEESQAIVDRVHRLESDWVQRHEPLPYYTLGTPSYLVAKRSSAEYAVDASRTNPLMIEQFGVVYDKLATRLSDELNGPVCYVGQVARPGFHVLLSSVFFALPFGTPHRDLQYEFIDWTGVEPLDSSQVFSLTVALQLPHGGAGLDLWDAADMDRSADAPDIGMGSPSHHVDYDVGSALLMRGTPVHRIASFKDVRPDDKRITLQGHGVWSGGRWILYW